MTSVMSDVNESSNCWVVSDSKIVSRSGFIEFLFEYENTDPFYLENIFSTNFGIVFQSYNTFKILLNYSLYVVMSLK
jgi:hypothetical protein